MKALQPWFMTVVLECTVLAKNSFDEQLHGNSMGLATGLLRYTSHNSKMETGFIQK